MSQQTKDERELLNRPGDTILETIEFLKMSQVELAERMGKTPSKINDIISAKEPITIATALLLEKVLGVDARFWMNLESLYREKLARIEQEEQYETCMDWAQLQPYQQLSNYGYIKAKKLGVEMVSELFSFYGVASQEQWTKIYTEKYVGTDYRMSTTHEHALGSMAAWLRIGELEKQKLELPEFDKNLFKAALQEVRSLVRKHPEDYAEQLQEICGKAGVAVAYSLSLPKAPVSGAARWVGGNPLIQLTDRHKTNDHFWFAFYHEAGHVLLHGKKEIFFEGLEGYQLNQEREDEANEFAGNQLLPEFSADDIPAGRIDENIVRQIARRYQTHPAIVRARLVRMERVTHAFGKSLQIKIDLTDFISYAKPSEM